ncbi:MAG: hypothetical protein H7Y31_03110, partial [Chitinophagaceae bacterium]|nr:hypothetical protein [Chitinophagaceae bacterium]
MRPIFLYLQQYLSSLNRSTFILTSLLVTALIIINYTIGIESTIRRNNSFAIRFAGFAALYAFVFGSVYLIHFKTTNHFLHEKKKFALLFTIAVASFAFKIAAPSVASLFFPAVHSPWQRLWIL